MARLGDLPQDLYRHAFGPPPAGRRGIAQKPTRAERAAGLDGPPSADCLELARCIAERLERSVLQASPPPTVEPPLRAQVFDQVTAGIVIANGGDADAGTAATRLNQASGVAILDESVATDLVLATVTMDDPNVGILRAYGLEAEGRRQLEDIDFSLVIAGRRHRFPSLESQPMGSVCACCLSPFFAVIPPGKAAEIRVSNTSTIVPHLVVGRLQGWFFPVERLGDSLRSLIFRGTED